MRVAFTTLGCRLNQFETEGMRHRLEIDVPEAEVVGWDASADVFVINSCAVTARAEQKCRQLARGVKRRHPRAKVVVAGCYPQLSGVALGKLGEVDAVLGNEEKRRLSDYLPRIVGESGTVVEVGRFRRGERMAEEWIDGFGDHARATIKVQEGCDLRCSFCAIWRARGPSRSRPPRDVVQQAQRLAERGYEEIVLAGVHIGHYGRDLETPSDLVELLDMLIELVDEKVRFRVSSIDPSEVDLRLVRRLVTESRLCRYLHLPLQSGSTAVLKSMNRAYNADQYEALVESIRSIDGGFGLGADVIVGFPGETDAQFEQTRALLEASPVSFFHVFPYSDREATAAARMPDKVDPVVKAERSAILRALGRRKREAFARSHIGHTARGIIESVDERSGLAEVMLDDYMTVWVDPGGHESGRTVAVELSELDDSGRLRGHCIEAKSAARSAVEGEDQG